MMHMCVHECVCLCVCVLGNSSPATKPPYCFDVIPFGGVRALTDMKRSKAVFLNVTKK